MRFGTKASESAKATSSSSDGFVKYFKNGDTRLRFLEELDDWTDYYEHFDKEKQRSYPCTGKRKTCPGCIEFDRLTDEGGKPWAASRRYLVNSFDPDTGYVNLYKVPVSLIDDLSRYSDKDGGTILARDYTVARYTKKDDGKIAYSVDREEKDPADLSVHKEHMKDHQLALQAQYLDVFGVLPDDESVAPSTTKAKAPKAAKKATVKVAKAEEEKEEIPSDPAEDKVEPSQESDSDQGEDVELGEEDLRKMSAKELKALFVQCGLTAPKTDDTDKLSDALIEALAD